MTSVWADQMLIKGIQAKLTLNSRNSVCETFFTLHAPIYESVLHLELAPDHLHLHLSELPDQRNAA